MPPRRRPNEVNGKSPAPPAATSRTPKAASTKASKAASKAGIKARGTGKAHKLAPPLPCGEILTDLKKKQWKIGEGIGQGGFGLIYLASDDVEHSVGREAEYVMKVEPVSNGPLFCELHFYQRAAKPEYIEEFTKSKKLKYLGVPKFITTGQHSYNGQEYRFLVMQRFGTDLQKLFESSGKRFPRKTICCIGLRMLDALEYMHSHEYVHADIKAANLLLGCKKGVVNTNEVYLVDFGLAFRYDVEGRLKEYKEDPRRAHDGTIEFTSIDAHNGVAPGRRGDLEILGYCLLQWHAGSLPWEKNLNNKEYVRKSKIEYMSNIDSLMSACFPSGDHPAEIKEYLKYVSKLDYQQTPNYNTLRTILRSGFPAAKKGAEWTLEFDAASSSQSPKKGTKRKSSENDLPAPAPRSKTKKKSAPCVVESLTPAMKERMAKITAASSSSAGSIGTGRRLVKRSKAVKTDIAVQTSPAQGRKKKP